METAVCAEEVAVGGVRGVSVEIGAVEEDTVHVGSPESSNSSSLVASHVMAATIGRTRMRWIISMFVCEIKVDRIHDLCAHRNASFCPPT